nr:hypothetical protein [uncultured Pseudoxanthomonas sp.]
MSTDVQNQHLHVVAKDLLIAALATGDQIRLEPDPEVGAKQLAQAYKIILAGIKEAYRS